MTEITQEQLLEKLKLLQPESDEQRNNLTCALIGHSMIQTTFFGYFYCARCEEQVGDNLGGIYNAAERVVIVGHNCDTCRANYEKLTWKDKLFCPEPFEVEES